MMDLNGKSLERREVYILTPEVAEPIHVRYGVSGCALRGIVYKFSTESSKIVRLVSIRNDQQDWWTKIDEAIVPCSQDDSKVYESMVMAAAAEIISGQRWIDSMETEGDSWI